MDSSKMNIEPQKVKCELCQKEIYESAYELHKVRCESGQKFEDQKSQSKIEQPEQQSGVRYSQIFQQNDPQRKYNPHEPVQINASKIGPESSSQSSIKRTNNQRIFQNVPSYPIRPSQSSVNSSSNSKGGSSSSSLQKSQRSQVEDLIRCPQCMLEFAILDIQGHISSCIGDQIPCQFCGLLFPLTLFNQHIPQCTGSLEERQESQINHGRSSRVRKNPPPAPPSVSEQPGHSTETLRSGNIVTIINRDARGNVIDEFSYEDQEDVDEHVDHFPDQRFDPNQRSRLQNSRTGPGGGDQFERIFGDFFSGMPGLNGMQGIPGMMNSLFNAGPTSGSRVRSNIINSNNNNDRRGNYPPPIDLISFLTTLQNRDYSNNGGLREEEMKDFSTYSFKKPQESNDNQEDLKKQKDENDADLKCVICLSQFEEGEKIKALDCLHKFHDTCIDQWLKQNTHCPICKKDMREFVRN